MDVSTINDVTVLKSMAYDQIVAKEQAERNLQVINARIVELVNMIPNLKDAKKPKSSD